MAHRRPPSGFSPAPIARLAPALAGRETPPGAGSSPAGVIGAEAVSALGALHLPGAVAAGASVRPAVAVAATK